MKLSSAKKSPCLHPADRLTCPFPVQACLFICLLLSGCVSIPLGGAHPTQAATSQPETAALESSPSPLSPLASTPTRRPAVHTPTTTPPSTQSTAQVTNTQPVTPSPSQARNTPLAYERVSELLFLSSGKLASWNPANHQINLLTTRVSEYSTSADGQKIAILRTRGVIANGEELFDLSILDTPSKQIQTLVEEIAHLAWISISPDSKWVAYATQEGSGPIHIIPTDRSSPPVEIGSCLPGRQPECAGTTAWSLDSRNFSWSDSRGIWNTNLFDLSPSLMISNTLEISDPKGSKSRIQVSFSHLSWSPMGRYILAQVNPTASQVYWQAVLDTRLGRLAEVPGSFSDTHPVTNTIWTQTGLLAVAHTGDALENTRTLQVDFLRVLPAREDLLAMDRTLKPPIQDFLELPVEGSGAANYYTDWLAQIGPHLFSFILTLPGGEVPPMLFTLDSNYNILQNIGKLEEIPRGVLWSPDGEGALVVGRQGKLLYLPVSGEQAYNLGSVIGSDATAFTWLPASPPQP